MAMEKQGVIDERTPDLQPKDAGQKQAADTQADTHAASVAAETVKTAFTGPVIRK